MKRIYIVLLGFLLLSLTAAHAQQSQFPPGAIIEGFVGSPENIRGFDPVSCSGAGCDVADLLFPNFIGIDPITGAISPNASDGLVTGWQISPDFSEFVFTLRQGMLWSDGTPITARDAAFTFDALEGVYGLITETEVLDDYRLRVVLDRPGCQSMASIRTRLVPAHAYESPDDVYGSEFSQHPTITAGLFRIDRIDAQAIVLVPDTSRQFVSAGAYVFLGVESRDALIEQLRAGEVNFVRNVPLVHFDTLSSDFNVQTFEYAGRTWDYIGLNIADPDNSLPEPDLDDEEGEDSPIEQQPHPIFGDLRVRQALQYALDVNALMQVSLSGHGEPMASYIVPNSWAYAQTLATPIYNRFEAERLLDEAGWRMASDGIRRAQGAQYAPDGTPLRFSLITAEHIECRTSVLPLIQAQWQQIGVEVEVSALDFSTLLDTLFEQTFDAYLLSWADGVPSDPGPDFFLSDDDSLVSGLNLTAYNNAEVARLAQQANTVPDCDPFTRRNLYRQIQEIIARDQPYLWLYVVNEMSAASAGVRGFAPRPFLPLWNVAEWTVFN